MDPLIYIELLKMDLNDQNIYVEKKKNENIKVETPKKDKIKKCRSK